MTSHIRRKQKRAVLVVAFFIVSNFVVLAAGSIQGFQGGGGDGKFSYGGCVCHIGESQRGSGIVDIWVSTLTPDANEEVTVIVNVTEDVLSDLNIIGVFLLRSMTGSDSDLLSEDGWRIITDPNGNKNSYVKKTSPGPGSTVSFEWVLLAPFRGGTYNLTARVHHGGDSNTWFEEGEVKVFSVTGIILEQTSLVLEAPSEVQKNERFTVSARLTNEGGNPLEDSEVIFYRITNYGKLTLGSNVTDAEGYANYSDTSYEGGIFKLEALYGGSSSYEPSNATVEIATLGDEEPEPFLIGGVPLEILIVVNIVVVGVWMTFGYVLYQLYRIRKAGKEEWELEES